MRLALCIGVLVAAPLGVADAAEERAWVGDPSNGKKLYASKCASCHGKAGDGGRSGVSLRDSGRMNLIRDDQMYAMIELGKGLKRSKEHRFKGKLKFLDIWDVIQHSRDGHQTLAEFFPTASRYVAKDYTIDKFGLERIEKATGKAPKEKTAAVFTFFSFEGEEGRLQYVPQDPIKLDQLKKKLKSGYLVFLPFEAEGFEGEVGVAMDPKGQITRMAVHSADPKAELMNKSLSRFEGLGKKGQTEPFKVAGGKAVAKLAEKVFRVYMRAMETVTMYDRDENERTWADQE